MAHELRGKAIRLLARRDRSRAEMRRVLDPQGSDPQGIDRLLDELQRDGWLSEERLAEQLVHGRRNRAGTSRIRLELKRRGLQPDIVSAATEGLEADDFAIAAALWQRRFGKVAQDRPERERQLRFLLARGFNHAVALKVLRNAGDPDVVEFQASSDDV